MKRKEAKEEMRNQQEIWSGVDKERGKRKEEQRKRKWGEREREILMLFQMRNNG